MSDFPLENESPTNVSASPIVAPPDGVIVTDATLVSEVLRSKDFRVVDYAWHYGEIAGRTGLDFDTTIQAMRAMPLANEDAAHKDLRSRSARAISSDWLEHASVMPAQISELVARTFQSDREIDLVSDVAFPIFSLLYERWSGLTLDAEPGVSQVFCGRMSLNRRRQIEKGLTRLDAALDDQALRVPRDVAISFAILASDALVGSLSLSLWEILSGNSGARLSEISFPENLPETAVPYVDRVAGADIEMQGTRFTQGQRVRLRLDGAGAPSSPANQPGNLFFGAGRHLCVGKAMTDMIWRSAVEALAGIHLRVTPVSLVMRRPDHVFRYPQSAKVRLHD